MYGHEEVVTKPGDQDNECNMMMGTRTIKLEEDEYYLAMGRRLKLKLKLKRSKR